MNNEKKKKQPTATIVLDKLVFSCESTVEDNFNDVVEHDPNYILAHEFNFNNTKLERAQDPSKRYKHSFQVFYKGDLIGVIDFKPVGRLHSDLIRFTVCNEVFYKDRLKYVPHVLTDLNLQLHNFTRIDIALDCYKFNPEQEIRRNLRKKTNTIKLLGKYIEDRNQVIKEITYYNHGSLNNPYKIRTILIQNKKKTFETECYDKDEEIKESGKDYILEFHKLQNPQMKNLHRAEVRLKYEEIRRFIKKQKKPLTFDDLFNQQFLYNTFTKYLDRTITIYENQGKKKVKLSLSPIPVIQSPKGILQPTLPALISLSYNSDNKNFKFISNNNSEIIYKNNYNNKYTITDTSNDIFIYKLNNSNKIMNNIQTMQI
ncbi:hypothetical protein [Dysgonomonas sp. 520]|uniref:hypothetical protein n=1 Tax=Dysgonomonas sp. 520 TaxID=2302931 RepID=UPI0013D0494C|nr:hypothetical protein [Dysgonomonas sp. 520]